LSAGAALITATRMDVTLSPRARATVAWLAAALGLIVLFKTAHALTPFAWAIITAYIFHPFVARLHRKTRLPKQLIATWLYLLIGLLVTIALINLTPTLVQQIKDIQTNRIPRIIADLEGWFTLQQSRNARLAGIDTVFIASRLDDLGTQLADLLGTEAVPLLLSTFSFAIELLVYLVASFYLIVYGDHFVQSLRDFLNRRYHREFDRLLLDISSTLGAYLRGQALLVLIMSTASYAALRILDVDYALILAISTGLLELIPIIGPWSAGTIAVTVALFQVSAPYDWTNVTLAIVVGVTYFALRQLEDAFVIPLVIGRIVHLHPLLVILVLVLGTSLGGVLGLILAVPVAAVVKIIASFFYAKVMAREQRHVQVIGDGPALAAFAAGFSDWTNATVVLLIQPGALSWDDLDLVCQVGNAARDHAIDLSAVTPDGVAGALTTTAGIPTTTIPTSSPVPELALAPFR